MRLLYDDQIFCMQKYGGISRVFVELFRVLEYEDSIEWDVQVEFPHNAYIREFEETYRKITAYSQFLGGADFRGKGRLYTATRKILPTIKPQQDILTALRNGKTDLFHPTYYDDYFLEKIENVPFVITVHDMIHELYPENFDLDKVNTLLGHPIILEEIQAGRPIKKILERVGVDEAKFRKRRREFLLYPETKMELQDLLKIRILGQELP